MNPKTNTQNEKRLSTISYLRDSIDTLGHILKIYETKTGIVKLTYRVEYNAIINQIQCHKSVIKWLCQRGDNNESRSVDRS